MLSQISPPNRSALRRTTPEELHDLVCVGFGPASLAIAVALHDILSTTNAGPAAKSCRQTPKVAFLERQAQFAWHAGMLVPGATMQITFIKDLATLRNPKSDFTFLNYLHRRQRLIHFSNLGTFLPLRLEYEDYLRWCAGWFEEVVNYDQEVLDVTPEKSSHSSKIDSFLVRSKNGTTGEITKIRSKQVIIAVGGKPKVPQVLPLNHPHIYHSSRYARVIPSLLKEIEPMPHVTPNSNGNMPRTRPLHIAVIGNGQSAAEIFNDLHSRSPHAKSTLLIKGAALRPSDDSPFVNEIFNPEHVNELYSQSPAVRRAAIAEDKGTNYGVVRLELLERIYGTIYQQRIRNDDEETWQHRVLPYRYVTGVEDLSSSGRVRLHVRNDSIRFGKSVTSVEETFDVDAVFAATGYVRDAHEEMLRPAEHLRPRGNDPVERWNVSRDYRVQFEPGTVSDDAGVWLQGCNETTHGLSDVLLSILATRAGEVVDTIFGNRLAENVNGSINGAGNGVIKGVTNGGINGTMNEISGEYAVGLALSGSAEVSGRVNGVV